MASRQLLIPTYAGLDDDEAVRLAFGDAGPPADCDVIIAGPMTGRRVGLPTRCAG